LALLAAGLGGAARIAPGRKAPALCRRDVRAALAGQGGQALPASRGTAAGCARPGERCVRGAGADRAAGLAAERDGLGRGRRGGLGCGAPEGHATRRCTMLEADGANGLFLGRELTSFIHTAPEDHEKFRQSEPLRGREERSNELRAPPAPHLPSPPHIQPPARRAGRVRAGRICHAGARHWFAGQPAWFCPTRAILGCLHGRDDGPGRRDTAPARLHGAPKGCCGTAAGAVVPRQRRAQV